MTDVNGMASRSGSNSVEIMKILREFLSVNSYIEEKTLRDKFCGA